MDRVFAAALVVAWLCVFSAHAWAEGEVPQRDRAAAPAACAGRLDAGRVVQCAVAMSPEVAVARARVATAAGRKRAAGVWLPSHPVVAATLGQWRRGEPEPQSAANWTVSLAQELELGGQRSARLAIADAEAAAAGKRVAIAEQEAGAAALSVFVEALFFAEAVALGDELLAAAEALAGAAEARAGEGLIPPVEARVARAEAIRLAVARSESVRRRDESRAHLALFLDRPVPASALPPSSSVVFSLPGDESTLAARALGLRGDFAAAEIERQLRQSAVTLRGRERIPNLTVSAFVERGEASDRIFGLGVSLPLPLPSPVGPSRAGEIAAARGELVAAERNIDDVRRRVRMEVMHASSELAARHAARKAFGGAIVGSARGDLANLREAITSRQLSVREAIVWQRSLIELLQSDLDTRLALAAAHIQLARVVGWPVAQLAKGTP